MNIVMYSERQFRGYQYRIHEQKTIPEDLLEADLSAYARDIAPKIFIKVGRERIPFAVLESKQCSVINKDDISRPQRFSREVYMCTMRDIAFADV